MMTGEAPQPITEVSLPPFRPGLAAALRPVLETHGVTIEEHANGSRVHFPAGTTMQRRWPVVLTSRYDIRLPDGYVLLYTVARDGQTNLYFDARDVPQDVRDRFL